MPVLVKQVPELLALDVRRVRDGYRATFRDDLGGSVGALDAYIARALCIVPSCY